MIFDLDPSGGDFATIKSTAQSLKHLLDELELPAYLKTTGSRGLHVAVPRQRAVALTKARQQLSEWNATRGVSKKKRLH